MIVYWFLKNKNEFFKDTSTSKKNESNITITNGIDTEMTKLENQFVRTAILVAFPLASDANNSDVISHGIDPFNITNTRACKVYMIYPKNNTWSYWEEYNINNSWRNREIFEGVIGGLDEKKKKGWN